MPIFSEDRAKGQHVQYMRQMRGSRIDTWETFNIKG